MPGEQADDALRAAAALKPHGITTILTRLGENLTKIEEFEEVTEHYLDLLDRVAASGLDAHISIKPTQLGLDLDRALCERNLDRLTERAGKHGKMPSPEGAKVTSGNAWEKATFGPRTAMSAALSWLLV
jgi:proline dehydrogenase